MSRITDKIIDFCTTEKGLLGLSIWRVSTGLCLLYWYLSHYSNRHYIWGPNGVIPHEQFAAQKILSLYRLSASPLYFEVVFHLGIVVAVLFAIGWRTRLVAVANYLFHYSIYVRNNLVTNGGDNLTIIVQFMLLFATTAAFCSYDSDRLKSKLAAGERTLWRQVMGAVHNAALLACFLQLASVYMTAGMHKISGEMWNSGTALYYTMRVAEYNFPPYSEWVYRNAYLVVAFSYLTIFFQVGFFFSQFNRATRIIFILLGLGFHAGIAVFMGLFTFSWFVVSLYPVLISDREYRYVAQWVRAQLDLGRLIVFYDGWCPVCIRSVKVWQAVDFFSLLDFTSFREPGMAAQSGLDLNALEQRIHTTDVGGGRVRNGFAAVTQITARLVVLWPLLPLLWTAKLLRLGDHAYDWFARRRLMLLSGCHPSGCEVVRMRPDGAEINT